MCNRVPERFCRLVSEDLTMFARALGVSCDELEQELNGHRPADVAISYGVSPAMLIDALLARSLLRLAEAVASGLISPEFGLEVFPRLAERARYLVHRGSQAYAWISLASSTERQ